MVGEFPDIFKTLPLFDGDFDAHKLKAKNCDVLFASYPAKTYIPAHRHDTDNYGVITRGELILTVRGITERYNVGDWYHIEANVEHSAKFDMDTYLIEFWFTTF